MGAAAHGRAISPSLILHDTLYTALYCAIVAERGGGDLFPQGFEMTAEKSMAWLLLLILSRGIRWRVETAAKSER